MQGGNRMMRAWKQAHNCDLKGFPRPQLHLGRNSFEDICLPHLACRQKLDCYFQAIFLATLISIFSLPSECRGLYKFVLFVCLLFSFDFFIKDKYRQKLFLYIYSWISFYVLLVSLLTASAILFFILCISWVIVLSYMPFLYKLIWTKARAPLARNMRDFFSE